MVITSGSVSTLIAVIQHLFIFIPTTVIRDDSRAGRGAFNVKPDERTIRGRAERAIASRKGARRAPAQVSQPSGVVREIRNGTNLRQIRFKWVSVDFLPRSIACDRFELKLLI